MKASRICKTMQRRNPQLIEKVTHLKRGNSETSDLCFQFKKLEKGHHIKANKVEGRKQ